MMASISLKDCRTSFVIYSEADCYEYYSLLF